VFGHVWKSKKTKTEKSEKSEKVLFGFLKMTKRKIGSEQQLLPRFARWYLYFQA
jgi:hypothetical protein